MRASTAYFVGAGSIVVAIAVGLGGGIVAGNIMHPIAPKQGPDTSKMERRAEPVAATTDGERAVGTRRIRHRFAGLRCADRCACAGAGRSKARRAKHSRPRLK